MSNLYLTQDELEVNHGKNTITSKIAPLLSSVEHGEVVSVKIDSTHYRVCELNLDALLHPTFDKHQFEWLYKAEFHPDIYRVDFCESAIRFIKNKMHIG